MLAASLLGTVGWAAYRAHWRFAGASTCAEESPQTLFKESIIEFQSCYGRRAEVNPQDSWIVYRWGAKEKRVVWMSVPRDPKPPQGWSRIVDMLDEIRARAEKQEPIREALAQIAYGTQRSEIWEWYNDLDKNQRVGKIRDLMKAIAF